MVETALRKFLYDLNFSHNELAADPPWQGNIESLGWDELVSVKRKLSVELKALTERIVELDKSQSQDVSTAIRVKRDFLATQNERLKQIREEVEKYNAELLTISDKISQAKNFLSMLEARLPTENEDMLSRIVRDNQVLIEAKNYRSERERDEILSKLKDASMKMEAIRATRTIRDQYSQLTAHSTAINENLVRLTEERNLVRSGIAEINNQLDALFDSRRKLSSQRESHLFDYDRIAKQFDIINARLDAMALMRKKQREQYGHTLPSDALFKVKEAARKKLESGEKLSFEELKLLYGEKD